MSELVRQHAGKLTKVQPCHQWQSNGKHKVVAEGTSVEAMEDFFMHAERLKTLYREAYMIQSRINDTILKSQAEAWTAAQKLCAELRKIAAENPRFATEFGPVDDFFSGGGQARGAL